MEKIENIKIKTNADKIRHMSIEELANVIECPYDITGKPDEIMLCIQDGVLPEDAQGRKCYLCCKAWLEKEILSEHCEKE